MGKKRGLLTAKEFNERYKKEVHSRLDAVLLSIKKYGWLLKYWDTATAQELSCDYILSDTCALCRFYGNHCSKCPLCLENNHCSGISHPWKEMWWNLVMDRKARARKYAEQVLALLRVEARRLKRAKKARQMKREEEGR